ncbi:hypothetical protein [Pedobacter roseus]|uniref:Uncharacterized protein n=1 Tax=Pedobacter roseus TaxID=336820 RepID=A0A7G9QKM1_9SPHI|nr:hypothetical protein [Pedobacter roseus]QNN43896.1 hypothetical protein H9L23_07365 [Pedobacter roseus]
MEPLPITYITDVESKKRQEWFDKYKLPVLNDLRLRQEKEVEEKRLDFTDIKTAIDFFNPLIKNLKKEDGVRVYFASPANDGTVNKGKCGKLTLILVVTIGVDKKEELPYYKFENGTFVPIDLVDAENGVHNYQLIKRDYLFKTLSHQDRLDGCKETKHIWFSLEQMTQTVKEMEYQNKNHSSIVKGFGICFTSYTNQDYIFLGSKSPVFKRRERLTICFTFIGANGDIGIEDIDPVEFAQRLNITRDKGLSDTFDTGIPAPPPSGDDNRGALDIQM